MSTRRLSAVLAGVLVMSALSIGPVAAKRPAPPSPAATLAERPLTPGEEAAADAKAAAAEAYVATQLRQGANLVSLACVTPNGEATAAGDGPSTDAFVTGSCAQPSYTLSVYARDQSKGHYCGPAVGQVIANYAWGVGAGIKYTQSTIAGWMGTDVNGGTSAFNMVAGLERATAKAPRRPANWAWVVKNLTDSDRDGHVSDQLHAYVQASVSGSRMPLAIPVKPHDRNSQYHLASWPRPVNSVGHWIAGYGWYAYWSNTDVPHIAYTDSSRDEGGSTGKFWDPTRHIASMILEHTGRIVW
jgi:hypothetical protein